MNRHAHTREPTDVLLHDRVVCHVRSDVSTHRSRRSYAPYGIVAETYRVTSAPDSPPEEPAAYVVAFAGHSCETMFAEPLVEHSGSSLIGGIFRRRNREEGSRS